MFNVKKMSHLVEEGYRLGGQEHVNEVTELIWKDRFYEKNSLPFGLCVLSAFVSSPLVDAFVNVVTQMAGNFKIRAIN